MPKLIRYHILLIAGLTVLSMACKKKEYIIQPVSGPPSEIKISASVPPSIYANKKQVILDAGPTPQVNGNRSLLYSWSCTVFPPDKRPSIINGFLPTATAIIPDTGRYVFLLRVRDNAVNEAIAEFPLIVYPDTLNGPPKLSPLPDKTVYLPAPVMLDAGSAITENPVDRKLFCAWQVLSTPFGSSHVIFKNPSSLLTEVADCIPGKYVFSVDIMNELNLSVSDTFEINVLPDSLQGSTRIYDDLRWTTVTDPNGNYIELAIREPGIFTWRNKMNTEVSVWNPDTQEWMLANALLWQGSDSGLKIFNSLRLNIPEGQKTKARIRFL